VILPLLARELGVRQLSVFANSGDSLHFDLDNGTMARNGLDPRPLRVFRPWNELTELERYEVLYGDKDD
jgi:hypothetical protein